MPAGDTGSDWATLTLSTLVVAFSWRHLSAACVAVGLHLWHQAFFVLCQLCNACYSEAEDYLEVLRVNVVGPMLVTKHFLPLLRKSSVRPKIVNISSMTGSLTRCREDRNNPMVSHRWMLQEFLMSQASLQHCLGLHFRCRSRPHLSACVFRSEPH